MKLVSVVFVHFVYEAGQQQTRSSLEPTAK